MKRILTGMLAAVLMLSLSCTALADPFVPTPDPNYQYSRSQNMEADDLAPDTFVSADYSAFSFIKKIPMKPKYTEAVDEKGTVEVIEYTTPLYGLSDVDSAYADLTMTKTMYVYLPFGYDPAQPYDILYLMHGAGEDERYWLSTERMGSGTLPMLDRAIAKGESKPVIIVTPTTNRGTLPEGVELPRYSANFGEELRSVIIPLIETRYSTYANGDISDENLRASRDHRAFAGFSAGSNCTISQVMMKSLEWFSYFGDYSDMFSNFYTEGEATPYERLSEVLNSEDYKDLKINFWYNGDGSTDYAVGGHRHLRNQVLTYMADRFVDGENYAWIEFKGGSHAYNCWLPHLYNSLRVFF